MYWKGIVLLALAGVLWVTAPIPLFVTALLIPVLSSIFGLTSVDEAFARFAHPIIFLFISGLLFARAFEKHGLSNWISLKLVSRAKGEREIYISLWIISFFLSMWMTNTSTTALLLPLAFSTNVSRKDILLLGIAYFSSIGGTSTLIGTPPNAIAGAELEISFLFWLKFGLPASFIACLATLVVLLLLVRSSKSNKFQKEELQQDESLKNLSQKGKVVLVVFFLTCVGWFFLPLFFKVKYLDTLVGICGVICLFVFRVLDERDLMHIDWKTVILFGGGLSLSLSVQKSGASQLIAMKLGHIFDFGFFLGIFAVVFATVLLTELMSNTALTALFVPVLIELSSQVGIPPQKLVIASAISASFAFALPVATPPNALVFASGNVSRKLMLKVGMILNITNSILITILATLFF